MKITMAHGSGGKSSAQLMKDIFAKHFSNEVLDSCIAEYNSRKRNFGGRDETKSD